MGKASHSLLRLGLCRTRRGSSAEMMDANLTANLRSTFLIWPIPVPVPDMTLAVLSHLLPCHDTNGPTRCPPLPTPPPGVVTSPLHPHGMTLSLRRTIPVLVHGDSCSIARTVDERGTVIEVDAHAGLPTVKLATEKEALQRQKERKNRRHAGQCTDANGRFIPWWEKWEQGEHERTMSVSFRDGCMRSYICVVCAGLSVCQHLCVFCGSRASGYR